VSNFTAPIGRNRRGAVVNGEIDLIAYEGAVLCFVEVKTRTSEDFASPLSAVDLRKQRQIIRTAKKYLKIFHLAAARIRYDVVTAVLGKNKRPKIEIVKDYFNESKFKKSFEADYH
jgi:putative endonuclease